MALTIGLASYGIIAPYSIRAREKIEVNPDTGLAISGFDPLAYFVDHKALMGSPDLELKLDGTVWQFRNSGNMAAFAAHPDIYMPQFGGYDPVAIARGASVPGHPLFWAVVGQRLYLFYDAAARTAFLADPGGIIERAAHKWPEVARSIGH
jgi:hypothetical protein